MGDLEFRVGGLSESFLKRGSGVFVVEHKERVVSVYISNIAGHKGVTDDFGLDHDSIVGGGSCSVNDYVVLYDISGTYNAIPKKPAKILADLVAEELRKKGVPVKGGKEEMVGFGNNSFWHEHEEYLAEPDEEIDSQFEDNLPY